MNSFGAGDYCVECCWRNIVNFVDMGIDMGSDMDLDMDVYSGQVHLLLKVIPLKIS